MSSAPTALLCSRLGTRVQEEETAALGAHFHPKDLAQVGAWCSLRLHLPTSSASWNKQKAGFSATKGYLLRYQPLKEKGRKFNSRHSAPACGTRPRPSQLWPQWTQIGRLEGVTWSPDCPTVFRVVNSGTKHGTKTRGCILGSRDQGPTAQNSCLGLVMWGGTNCLYSTKR